MCPSPRECGRPRSARQCRARIGRLARTFPAQIEALNRYRSYGEPAITVQNVSVGDGGKAIVGNVTQHASVMVPTRRRHPRREGAEGLGRQAKARFR